MNKAYLIKKFAELNIKTELAIHKKLSKIITNSYDDNSRLNSDDGDKIYFDINIVPIKELMNETDIKKVTIKTVSLD